jgi:hypothetical protein
MRNRQVEEMRAFAEDRREEHLMEIGRLEAQVDLLNRYEAAEDLLHDLERLRTRVAFELRTAGENGARPPGWSREAVGISSNGHAPRTLEYPDGLPSARRRRSR